MSKVLEEVSVEAIPERRLKDNQPFVLKMKKLCNKMSKGLRRQEPTLPSFERIKKLIVKLCIFLTFSKIGFFC